jgi:hypothetical protein
MGYMNRILKVALFVSPFLIAGLLFMVFQFTDPASVGPGGVLGVFTLIYLECLSILFIILRFGLYWVRKLLQIRRGPKAVSLPGMGVRKAYYIASIVAFAPVTLLAMHAYAQLQLTDIVLVILLMSIVTFYIIKRR